MDVLIGSSLMCAAIVRLHTAAAAGEQPQVIGNVRARRFERRHVFQINFPPSAVVGWSQTCSAGIGSTVIVIILLHASMRTLRQMQMNHMFVRGCCCCTHNAR